MAAFTLSAGLYASAPQLACAQTSPGVAITNFHSFDGDDGAVPSGPLVLGVDGDFYGTVWAGGPSGFDDGLIYKISPSGEFTVVHEFNGTDGGGLSDGLTLGSDGNFYGDTYGGPNEYPATIFQMTPSGAVTTLYTFDPNVDGVPVGGVVLDANGSIYGVADRYDIHNNDLIGGEVYKLTPAGSFSVLYTFSGGVYGHGSPGQLLLGGDNNIYGTTFDGGSDEGGSVFELTQLGELTTLYSFTNGLDGGAPYSGLTIGNDNNFYGLTSAHGANGEGTIYKLTLTGAFTTLYSFAVPPDGYSQNGFPGYSMILGTDGNFYGVTLALGNDDNGTVFQITPSGAFTTLYSVSTIFDPNFVYGANPFGSLIEGSDGALYGPMGGGGAHNSGALFKLTVPGLTGAAPRFDFNKDGHSDLIWYNTGTGDVAIWDMNDQTVLSFGPAFDTVPVSSGWKPIASTDINGDGYPDLLWWNSLTGEMSFWTMQNTVVSSYGPDFAVLADTTWKPVAIADVHGESYSLVFQNSATGDISRWMMNGSTVESYGGTLGSLGAKTPWRIVGAPDLNGDGKSDLLFWNNKTGEVSSWSCELANSQVLSCNGDFTQVSDINWHLAGSEDTNGDGHPDLIWWNSTTGDVSRWLMSGTTVTSYGEPFAQDADTTWQPTAIR